MALVKPWYASRTIWASIVAVFASIAGLFGAEVAPDDAALLTDSIMNAVAAAGAIIAVIGRIVARSRIGRSG